uniref:Uncharacterized protein n=1 Tax=Bionectria ochroleuca TaxID=29856 RepID=A0A8H7NKU1_BIOOC
MNDIFFSCPFPWFSYLPPPNNNAILLPFPSLDMRGREEDRMGIDTLMIHTLLFILECIAVIRKLCFVCFLLATRSVAFCPNFFPSSLYYLSSEPHAFSPLYTLPPFPCFRRGA